MRKSQAPSQKNRLSQNISQPASLPSLSSTIKQLANHKGTDPAAPNEVPCEEGLRIFSVVYGKPSKKKHKTWDGDGTLEIIGKQAVLKCTDGKIIGRTGNLKKIELEDGAILFVGSKEVEISSELSVQTRLNPDLTAPQKRKISVKEDRIELPVTKKDKKSLGPFSSELVCSTYVPKVRVGRVKNDFEPLDLPMPSDIHQWTCNPNNLPTTVVSVEPSLCRVLRKHQREGLLFLYNCVTGMRDLEHRGAILADEMGLGKTLQCVALIWTMLKQGPYGGAPTATRVLVVVPSSLVQNWRNEFIRWIGSHKIQTFVVDKNNKPADYKASRRPVLIISYEMFVKKYEDLKTVEFHLVICDEGHRLKNSGIQATRLLSQLPCKARVILSGTPIQNDLQEFYTLVDFVNPGLLGSPVDFTNHFEKPILSSREPNADPDDVAAGKGRANQLNQLTCDFILRRTQEMIGKYLPQKTEYVVFCEPSPQQKQLYERVVNYYSQREEDVGTTARSLSVVMTLRKICNHPHLLKNLTEEDSELASLIQDAVRAEFLMSDSSKLMFVDSVVKRIVVTGEKLILVSNFTQTLDLLAQVCSKNNCECSRFDGSTTSAHRSVIVSKFNDAKSTVKVLLLSSRAGGVGLNLIGASRLILYDSDWNPATDLQAMARIWREGQKKNVHIYRLLTSATIEEKIFQRQLKKTSLGENIVDASNSNSVVLSREELRDLFSYEQDDKCLTHDLLKCTCSGNGAIAQSLDNEEDADFSQERDCQIELQQTENEPAPLKMNQLLQWEHHQPPLGQELISTMFAEDASPLINFVFRNKTS